MLARLGNDAQRRAHLCAHRLETVGERLIFGRKAFERSGQVALGHPVEHRAAPLDHRAASGLFGLEIGGERDVHVDQRRLDQRIGGPRTTRGAEGP